VSGASVWKARNKSPKSPHPIISMTIARTSEHADCQHGYSVLFANAIDAINTLSAAQAQGALKTQLKRYLSPALLILDEGYLPIDQRGVDLLFQVISQRYERGSTA
jgi:DNA replication protein DnaC